MDDLISRQKAIEILGEHCKMDYNKICGKDCECVEYIALRDLPSAQKKGRWIQCKTTNNRDVVKCSNCLHTQEICGVKNYCSVCGADMIEDGETDG